MARAWTLQWSAKAADTPSSGGATRDQIPTTLKPSLAFSASSTQRGIWSGVVPQEYRGTGTLKCRALVGFNSTSTNDGTRWDAYTEFVTPGAGEAANVAAFDGTADSATLQATTTAYEEQWVTITLTPATTPAAGDHLRLALDRDHDHADDDASVSAHLLELELYEEI